MLTLLLDQAPFRAGLSACFGFELNQLNLAVTSSRTSSYERDARDEETMACHMHTRESQKYPSWNMVRNMAPHVT